VDLQSNVLRVAAEGRIGFCQENIPPIGSDLDRHYLHGVRTVH
jgi:hypothetical protein